MNDNLDWGDLINEALDRARGDSSEPVAGAKLRVTLSRMLEAREPGVNLGDFLRSEQLTFAGLVERWTDLKVIRRQGTDMLVARSLEEIPPEALQEPQPRALPSIRQDLYSALTLMGTRTRYFYDKSTDEVVALSEGQSQETANLVALPAASLEEEVRTRREFALSHGFNELLEALQSAGPLSNFRRALERLRLEREWHFAKYQAIRSRLIEWAAQHEIPVRPDWFSGQPAPRRGREVELLQLMRLIADQMTEEELRGALVPLRAVHALFNSGRRA